MQCEACGQVNAVEAERCAHCAAPLAAAPLAVTAPFRAAAQLAAGAPLATDEPLGTDAERAAIGELRARWQARAGDPMPARGYAGFAPRFGAFLIDGAILAIFALPLALAGFAGVKAGLSVMRVTAPVEAEDALTSLFSFAWLAMTTIYFTALHAGAGQTIGKALLGIRVRSARDLAAIGTARSLMRALGYFASSSLFGFGFLMVAFMPRRRAWHDYLAGTCVVRLARDEA